MIEVPDPIYQPGRRVFGPGPYLRGLRRVPARWGDGFPWDVPSIAGVDAIDLGQPVTLLAGDNGTGKSTLVELIADAMGFADEGGEMDRSDEMPAKPRAVLVNPDLRSDDPRTEDPRRRTTLEPVLSGTRPRNGYFLRAESFYNVANFVDSGHKFAPDLSLYGDVPLHGQSHGQSFLALAANRFGGDGLFILDEPEAALSVTGALALLAIVAKAAAAGSQFIIATHSPVLLAIPDAAIYELDEDGVSRCAYDALDSVRTTRAFLERPEQFIRAALGE